MQPMRRGMTVSALMHAALLLAILIGMPSWLDNDPLELPPEMVVEILPIANKTNFKPSPKIQEKKNEAKPEDRPKPKESAPKPEPEPEPKKEVIKEPEVTKPEAPKEEKPKEEKPKEEPKPKEEVKKEDEKKKKDDEAFEEILKDLAKKSDAAPEQKAINTEYDASKPLSASEEAFIQGYFQTKVKPHYRLPAGAMDAHKLMPKLLVELLPDGRVKDIKVMDTGRYATDAFFRAAVDNAIRAVRLGAPYDELPKRLHDKYKKWQLVEYTFDSSDQLY